MDHLWFFFGRLGKMNIKSIHVAIVGITGYTARELIRILLHHKEVYISHYISHSLDQTEIPLIYPEFSHYYTHPPKTEKWTPELLIDVDILFLCLPFGQSVQKVEEIHIVNPKIKIIDLSPDFRLQNEQDYTHWYPSKFSIQSNLRKQFIYGLPELYREKIRSANKIANPGCYPTACILGILPALESHTFFDLNHIIFDVKSGVSGAGKKSGSEKLLFCEINENFYPYKVGNHQHIPEIHQTLKNTTEQKFNFSFIPHLLPIERGILATIYIKTNQKLSLEKIHSCYKKYYETDAFVSVLDLGSYPEIHTVKMTNMCHIGLGYDHTKSHLIVASVIDNLCKGASSQAVQNMNLMMGIDELEGLYPNYHQKTIEVEK